MSLYICMIDDRSNMLHTDTEQVLMRIHRSSLQSLPSYMHVPSIPLPNDYNYINIDKKI